MTATTVRAFNKATGQYLIFDLDLSGVEIEIGEALILDKLSIDGFVAGNGLGIGADGELVQVKNNLSATGLPTGNDDITEGYSVLSLWYYSGEFYKCMDNTAGNAVWANTTLTIEDLGTMATQDSDTVSITGGAIAPIAITQDENNRLVTDTEKNTWNGKQDSLGYTAEDSTNKQNNLTADLTDTKYPTVTAVNAGLSDKEPTLTKGNLTETTSSILTIGNGTGAVMGSGTTIQVQQANTSQSGFLSNTDWNTFNGKQDSLGFTAEDTANKTSTFQATPDNVKYPTEKLVKDSLDNKAEKPTVTADITLLSTGWTANSQILTVTGVTATSVNTIIIPDRENGDLWADGNIYGAYSAVDEMTFTCETEPTSNIVFKVKIQEV